MNLGKLHLNIGQSLFLNTFVVYYKHKEAYCGHNRNDEHKKRTKRESVPILNTSKTTDKSG